MKRITIIYTMALILGLTAYPTLAAQYGTDVLEQGNPGGWSESMKTFDDKLTIVPGQQIEFDVWITDASGYANAGGFWIDYSSSTDKITYISGQLYNGTELPRLLIKQMKGEKR